MELKYANIKLESDYNLLLKSGMFWVAYPELTGDWSKDSEVINPKQPTESRSTINLHLGDCLEAMREMPDNAFELAIVDPPLWNNVAKMNMGVGTGKNNLRQKKKSWEAKIGIHLHQTKEYFNELLQSFKESNYLGWQIFINLTTF
jgi:hypothetical protein